jgi:hypothetical protein
MGAGGRSQWLKRFRVSNFAQTPSSQASRNHFEAISWSLSIRPFDKGSGISV